MKNSDGTAYVRLISLSYEKARPNLGLRQGPFLLLLLPLGHVLVVLLGLCEGADEGVEDPKEHVRFQF